MKTKQKTKSKKQKKVSNVSVSRPELKNKKIVYVIC